MQIELSQIPEQLEICEQVQPVEWARERESLSPIPSFPTRSPLFPEGKEVPGKGNWSGHNQSCPLGLGLPREEW